MMIIIIIMMIVVVVIIIIIIDEEKSVKYGPLQWELQEGYPGYTGPAVQYHHGHSWRLVKDSGRRITEAAGKKRQKMC